MIHDPNLLEGLSARPTECFSGSTFRATRAGLHPLAPSTNGGRWAPAGGPVVLYTSLEREGALAEITYHWSRFIPRPSKPAKLHRLTVTAGKTLRLIRTTLEDLSVPTEGYDGSAYDRTQAIGAAAAFLGCDGILVPSARWHCDNLILFTDNHGHDPGNSLDVIETETIDWLAWASDKGLLPP
ncbi:RES domain-containing protein [Azospirillum humicireducens]|uniref:RES domain-containing protein n=1 Tax=Azospirillum humicireducens TaxID=1226968 RepID=A0A160JCW5_9PROT|nr:RES domain-containing protein [Azospirillum humicireducens]